MSQLATGSSGGGGLAAAAAGGGSGRGISGTHCDGGGSSSPVVAGGGAGSSKRQKQPPQQQSSSRFQSSCTTGSEPGLRLRLPRPPRNVEFRTLLVEVFPVGDGHGGRVTAPGPSRHEKESTRVVAVCQSPILVCKMTLLLGLIVFTASWGLYTHLGYTSHAGTGMQSVLEGQRGQKASGAPQTVLADAVGTSMPASVPHTDYETRRFLNIVALYRGDGVPTATFHLIGSIRSLFSH